MSTTCAGSTLVFGTGLDLGVDPDLPEDLNTALSHCPGKPQAGQTPASTPTLTTSLREKVITKVPSTNLTGR